LKTYGERIGNTTNNIAEYEAVIFALKKAKALYGKEKTKKMTVDFRVDSELVARQLNGQYKVEEEHLQPLFMKVWNLKFDFGKLSFTSVPREQNKEADRLVNEALDKEQKSML
jgi:ribonuclease HI